jgi:hypothetical protein
MSSVAEVPIIAHLPHRESFDQYDGGGEPFDNRFCTRPAIKFVANIGSCGAYNGNKSVYIETESTTVLQW